MNTPLVSITSAFYNTGPLMLEMIKSVFAQTCTDWELILLDDGSTDDSLQIAQCIDDPRVKVFSNGQNRGRSYSLNRLTELSSGKYIARMDSDDLMSLTRIQKQVALLAKESIIDAVGTGICYLDENENPLGHWVAPITDREICRNPSRSLGICHGSIIARREWFQRYHYNEKIRYAVDFDFLLRAYESTTFKNVKDPLYYYRLEQSYSLKKQAVARSISAKFLRDYHLQKGRADKAVYHTLIQYAKLGCTAGMVALGMKKRLLAKRYSNLSLKSRKFYQDELQTIFETQLPIKATEGMEND